MMKTQLLEDIGENAALPPAPFKKPGNSNTAEAAAKPAPAQKPAVEPFVPGTPQPDQEPTPLELDSVFEEIAALEAQYVAPRAQPEPALAPPEPRLAPQPAPPAALAPEPGFDFTPPSPPRQAADPFATVPGGRALPVRPAEPLPPPPELTAAPDAPQAAAVAPDTLFDFTPPAPAVQAADPFTHVRTEPRHPPASPAAEAAPILSQAAPGPVFDFTPPAPELPAADPFTRAGSGRSGQRYLVLAACLLAAVLVILGGRWFYQARNDGGSLALVANQAKAPPQVDKTAQQPAPAVRDGGAAPAAPATRAPAAVPPMVMLEPDPSAAAKPEPAPEPVAGQDEASPAPKPEPVAKQAPPAPSPKPASRVPARQPAAAAVETGQPEVQDTSMTATLKACRQRGYDAAQCVKRACSMTKYGFACRGQ